MDWNDKNNIDLGRFGWWPELFGTTGVALLIWFLIAFARGSV